MIRSLARHLDIRLQTRVFLITECSWNRFSQSRVPGCLPQANWQPAQIMIQKRCTQDSACWSTDKLQRWGCWWKIVHREYLACTGTAWFVANEGFVQHSRLACKQAVDNAIIPVLQVFTGSMQTAVLGWPLVTAKVTPGRAGMTLEHSPWPPLHFLSWKLHVSFPYYSYADKFQTHVSASDLFCSAQSPMLTTADISSEPPASPQNELLEPPALPSKHSKTASQNIHTSRRRGELLHFTKKCHFLLILSP